MFNAETLALMKPDAFLVNTARGGIVNEDALYTALTTGKLRGAGLDVLDHEPPDAKNKLFGLENVIFSPHMAGVTEEANDRMAITAIENILSVFDGRPNAATRQQGSAPLEQVLDLGVGREAAGLAAGVFQGAVDGDVELAGLAGAQLDVGRALLLRGYPSHGGLAACSLKRRSIRSGLS